MRRSLENFPAVRWKQMVAGLSAAFGAFALGNCLGWSAPATRRLVDEGQYFPITSNEMEWIASVITLGCAISCLPIGLLMKKFGRKWTMLSLVVPFLIGWLLVIWAQNFVMLLIGRFILGLAGGAFCVTAPQYSAEISQKEIRGITGSFFQLMLISGILFVYVIGSLTTVFWMNIICAMVPLVFGVIFFFMPESPVYLIIENRENDATESYKCLRGKHYNPIFELEQLKHEISQSKIQDLSLREAFRKPSNKRAIIIGFSLMLFMQMSGVNVVIFFSTTIFEEAHTGLSSDASTIFVGTIHVIASLVGTLLVDRLGRKLLLLTSIIMMTISLIALGTFFYIRDTNQSHAESISWLPLLSLCTFIISFALGFGPIPFMMLSEIYSKEINAIASPLTGFFTWILAFALTSAFGPIAHVIGIAFSFWILGAFCIVGAVFILFMVPETKGKSLSQIQNMLQNNRFFLRVK